MAEKKEISPDIPEAVEKTISVFLNEAEAELHAAKLESDSNFDKLQEQKRQVGEREKKFNKLIAALHPK